RITSCGWKKS
ncbi:putative dNA replication protein dnaC, partial [Escherichia coli 88.1467]